jgi:tRNA G18 (ribose-2'-O)-methylase SpoU
MSDDAPFDDGEAIHGAGPGVGPHPRPWPDDPRLDPELLAHGDRRNVIDRYRYWRVEAIAADLDRRRHPFHVAVENWARDPNIGAVVRSANAFMAAAVHIVGRRRWNRRGAMMTERYQHVLGSRPIHAAELPAACVLLLGQEGPGLSEEARGCVSDVLSIPQFGSTRSINASAAAAVAMYEWCRRHASSEGAEG